MEAPKVIHVERIVHDPLLGHVSGVVIRREPNGDLTRLPVTAPVSRPALGHEQAAARLRLHASKA
jgi:hypothetical protein